MGLFDKFLMILLRKEINHMNTQKEKQNRSAVRRRTLLESQNVLFIDEASKMIEPIAFDDLPFKVRPPVMFEPSEKEVA